LDCSRRARVTITTKTWRGRRSRTAYVKVTLPLTLVEKLGLREYRICLDEETGRITLEPVYAEDGGSPPEAQSP